MFKTNVLYLLLPKFAVFFFLISGTLCIAASKPLHINVDAASFRFDNEKGLMELYYSFSDDMITYNYVKDKFSGTLFFRVSINSGNKLIDLKEWIVTHSKDSLKKESMDLLGQKNFALYFGKYTVKVFVKDLNDTLRKLNREFEFSAKPVDSTKIGASDIQLAKFIESEKNPSMAWNDAFKKNTLFVIPNPSNEIFSNRPYINSYLEIYNAQRISRDSIKIEYQITDAANHTVLTYPKKRAADNDGLIEILNLPVEALPSGVYYYKIVVSWPYSEPKDSVFTQKKIYILNPEMPPEEKHAFVENLDFEKSEFAPMNDEQVENEFQQALYIATQYEKDLYYKCATTEAKKHFMFGFWKTRNLDSTKSYNIAREKYRDLIQKANKDFSNGSGNNGWKSDRGRILIKYGEPTLIEHKLPEGNQRPYEIWNYDTIRGGVQFYFVNMGTGNLILVNSNMPGEAQNSNWFNQFVLPQGKN